MLGGGFAGLWSAAGAGRIAAEIGASGDIDITVVNRTPYRNIRVRNYEPDLSDVCIPLEDILSPIDVRSVLGEVTDINTAARQVRIGAKPVPTTTPGFSLGTGSSPKNGVGH